MKKLYDPHRIENKIYPAIEYALSRDVAVQQAEREGLVVVEADDYTLQLDFDNEEAFDQFVEYRLGQLIQWVTVTRVWWTESKSGNKHVYVNMLSPRPLEARLTLQASLGSDGVREFLNLMRYEHDTDKPVLFFERPDAPQHVIYATDGYQPQLEDGAPVGLLTEGGTDFPFGFNDDLEVKRDYSSTQG